VNRCSLSVLCDLRPAFEGFFGISHEARSMFSLFHELDDVDVTGLIHHPGRMLARGLPRRAEVKRGVADAQQFAALSRLVASTTSPTRRWEVMRDKAATALDLCWLHLLTTAGVRIPLDRFEGAEFGDFLWQTLFWASLPSSEFERCRTARYASLWSPWSAMHVAALFPWSRRYPLIDTSGYDMLIAQTPWPGRVDRKTRLVIRYHDAMPVFLPHTVKEPRLHSLFHLSALKQNAKHAVFACVSAHARDSLLKIFPHLEKRAFVAFDGIAEAYFPGSATPKAVARIIASRIDATTELQPRPRANSVESTEIEREDFRFVLMVSTLEPRKNHLRLIAAWEALRIKLQQRIALVFVGSMGWGNDRLLRAMRGWQMRRELFHLSALPPSEMRILYAAADAVVCPSVAEGFDLPSVEAMRCGGAVVASDIAVHREILGDAALYCDPYSDASICDALMRLLTDQGAQQDLRSKARIRATAFDKSKIRQQWDEIVDFCRIQQGTCRSDG
jgi:glycosyltransferase involved in cell wall biosynthesis